MKYLVMKMSKVPSKTGGHFYYIFFKDEEGKSFKTCVYPQYRNFLNWKPLIIQFTNNSIPKKPIYVEGLRIKQGNLIDADSQVKGCEDVTDRQMVIRKAEGENSGSNAQM